MPIDRTRYGTKLPSEVASIEVILRAEELDYSVITSTPPPSYHKVHDIYANKIGNKYHIVMVINDTPES